MATPALTLIISLHQRQGQGSLYVSEVIALLSESHPG